MNRDEELLYRIWLNAVCDNDPRRIQEHIRAFDSAEEVFRAKPYDLRWKKLRRRKNKINRQKAWALAEHTLETCREGGIGILTIDDPEYPELLRNIPCPPRLLYVKGTLPPLNRLLTVAIVGTRNPTAFGTSFTRRLAYDLAGKGFLIVSGMAVGTDGQAHAGALEAGGKTVAVLAGGVDVIYPKAHARLYSEIIQNGAVISEQPPGIVGRPEFYEARNRIIAGLSFGVIIPEGREKSGTAITQRHAVENNRDVFVVPGFPSSPQAELPNAVLRDGGILVRDASDVWNEYLNYEELLQNGRLLKNKPRSAAPELPQAERRDLRGGARGDGSQKQEKEPEQPEKMKRNLDQFSGKERMILEYLCHSKEAVHIDEIAKHCGISAAQLGSTLTLLQMKGVVRQCAGARYTLSE